MAGDGSEPAGESGGDDPDGRARATSWLRATGRRPAVGRGIRGRLRAVWHRFKRIGGGIHALLVGDPERYPVRAIIFVAIVSALVAFIGLFLLVVENLDPSANSGPLVRTIVRLLTNFMAWAALSVLAAIWIINRWWHRAAKKAAAETRYSTSVVKRLRQELTSTDGTVRLIGTRDHSRNQLRAKLMRAFADQHATEQPGRDVDVSAPEAEVTGKALGEAPEAALPSEDSDTRFRGDASAEPDTVAEDAPDDDPIESGGVSLADSWAHLVVDENLHDYDDLPTALKRGSDAAAELSIIAALGGYMADVTPAHELTLVQDAVERDPDLAITDDGDIVLSEAGVDTTADRRTDADRDLEATLSDLAGDRAEAAPEAEEQAATADTDGDADARAEAAGTDSSPGASTARRHATSFRQALQTFRMDVATALNFQELLTRFALPAVATVILTFTVAGTPWFAPWVYPVILAGATLVGTISYGTFKWRRRRKLRSLREESESRHWPSCAVLAKRVDTPEQTMYAAWMGGNRYADFDKQRLVDTVADRWHQRLHGDEVAPAIQQKFAREIRHARPLLHQFEHRNPREGRKGIENDIIDVIREAKDPDGMVAKRSLAEQVVERGPGVGHDPDLIAEVYADLVPRVLTETDITLRDTDGIERSLTAVHLRWMDIPDDLAQIRAQFANQFSADEEPAFELPEVETAGVGEPAYADQLADLPTEGPVGSPSSAAD